MFSLYLVKYRANLLVLLPGMFWQSSCFTVVWLLTVRRGQCGGSNFNGATCCVSGATCSVLNPYYSQCVPSTQVSVLRNASHSIISQFVNSRRYQDLVLQVPQVLQSLAQSLPRIKEWPQLLRIRPVLPIPQELLRSRHIPPQMLALVDLGSSLTMFVVHITVYPIMNQSPVLVVARVDVDPLPPQCASLVLCVRYHFDRCSFHIYLQGWLILATGGEQSTVGSDEDWHYSVSMADYY